MSEPIDHAKRLRSLVPNGDGYYSEWAEILSEAADYIERTSPMRDPYPVPPKPVIPLFENYRRLEQAARDLLAVVEATEDHTEWFQALARLKAALEDQPEQSAFPDDWYRQHYEDQPDE